MLFLADQIFGEQDPAIVLTVNFLDHFALATTAGAFVHQGEDIVIRRDDLDGRTVDGDPLFLFAEIQKHTIDAFFGTRAGIQIIGKHFVDGIGAVMDHHLTASEMSVTEGRRQIKNRSGGETMVQLALRDESLQIKKPSGKEAGIIWRHKECGIPHAGVACHERHQDEILLGQPGKGLAAQVSKIGLVTLGIALLIGRTVVGNDHAIRIATTHVWIEIVDYGAILGPGNRRFDHPALAWDIIGDFKNG